MRSLRKITPGSETLWKSTWTKGQGLHSGRSLETALPCRTTDINQRTFLWTSWASTLLSYLKEEENVPPDHLDLSIITPHSWHSFFKLNDATVPTFLECLLHSWSSIKTSRYKVTLCGYCHERVHILTHKHRIERSKCGNKQVLLGLSYLPSTAQNSTLRV